MADRHERLVGAMLISGHAQQDCTTLSVLTQLTVHGRYFACIQSPFGAGVKLPQLNEIECDELILLLSKAKAQLHEQNTRIEQRPMHPGDNHSQHIIAVPGCPFCDARMKP